MNEEVKKVFSGSEVGVLIEDFEGQVKAVAEGVLSLGQKLDRVVGEVKGDLKDFIRSETVPELKDDLKAFIRSEIASLRAEINSLLETRADAARIEALEQRVAAVERLIGKQTG